MIDRIANAIAFTTLILLYLAFASMALFVAASPVLVALIIMGY